MSRHFARSKWRLKFPILVAPWLFLLPVKRCWDWGVLLALLGMALRWWGAGHLGKPTDLVTAGPYGYLRHPLYLGTFLMIVGLSLVTGRPETVTVLTVSFIVFYVYKVRLEESRLERRLGGIFRRYREMVPALTACYPQYALKDGKGFYWAKLLERREYHSLIILLAVFLMIHVNEYVWEYLKR
jgi:uncharacterized membrane protein